jgi:hypothetical protein
MKYSTTNNQQLSCIQKYNLGMVLNLFYPNLRRKMEVKDLVLWGITKLRNENETKRNEMKRNEMKRNETKRNEAKRFICFI